MFVVTLVTLTALARGQEPAREVRLRAGVIHTPPFGFVEQDPNSQDFQFRGFHIDLIERLKIFRLGIGQC